MIKTFQAPWLSSSWTGSVSTNTQTEPTLDMAACVERARNRDEDAARQLMERLHPLVLKLVRAHLPRRTPEEDLVQIVFMKVFANLDRYSGAVPIEHWVSRIAVNTCFNHLDAERIRPEYRWSDLSEEQSRVLESLAESDADLPPDQAAASREIVELLLAQMAPQERLLLTLLYLDGHTPREVQRLTGWNSLVVRGRAFRARQKLRKLFRQLTREKST
ncbi:MAG: sigma-70 family RNA polymerase sigma factor [Verrucomicrobiota bacterium]